MTGFDSSSRNLRLFRSIRSSRTTVFTESMARSSSTSFDRISPQVAIFDDLNSVRFARSVSRIRHRSRRLYSVWKSELVRGGWRFNMKSTPVENAACSITFVSSCLVALIAWRVFAAATLARCALERDSIQVCRSHPDAESNASVLKIYRASTNQSRSIINCKNARLRSSIHLVWTSHARENLIEN